MIIVAKLKQACPYRTSDRAEDTGELPVNIAGSFLVSPGNEEASCYWEERFRRIPLDDFSRASGIDLHLLRYIVEHYDPEMHGDGIIDGDGTFAIPIWEPDPGLLARLYPETEREGDEHV